MADPGDHTGQVSHTASPAGADLDASTNRLVRTVDGLREEQYGEPSGLPGWTRGHVVAHLALHAEALGDALGRLGDGAPTAALYPSAEERDAAIDALAASGPGPVRERVMQACGQLRGVLAGLPERAWTGSVTRTPGGAAGFEAHEGPFVRCREVEVHHADLDVGYGPQDWPVPFAVDVLESLRERTTVTLLATDVGRTWYAEDDPRTVAGTAAMLAWWLTGRGRGTSLTCNGGDLPRIEEW